METERDGYQIPEQIKTQIETNLGFPGSQLCMALEDRVSANPNLFQKEEVERKATGLTWFSKEEIEFFKPVLNGIDGFLDTYLESDVFPIENTVFKNPSTNQLYLICNSAKDSICQAAQHYEVPLDPETMDLQRDPNTIMFIIYNLAHDGELIVEEICSTRKIVYHRENPNLRGISPHRADQVVRDLNGENSSNYRTAPIIEKINPEEGTWKGDSDFSGISSDTYEV